MLIHRVVDGKNTKDKKVRYYGADKMAVLAGIEN